MPASLLRSVLSSGNLQQAWQKNLANDGVAGVDGVSLQDFALSASTRLKALQKEVLRGDYQPQPLKRAWMPREGKTPRALAIPTVKDRVLQTAVALVLSPILELEFETASYAYRPQRSVQKAVARITELRDAGFRWVVDADISAYFDTIDHQRLRELVAHHVPDERLQGLIAQWLQAPVDEGGRRTVPTKGIAQGSPLSPLLANLYLDALDEAILGQSLHLVRYADDFIILCREKAQAEDALELTSDVLQDLKLGLNNDKTRIAHFSHGFRFLGKQFLNNDVIEVPVLTAPEPIPTPVPGPPSAPATTVPEPAPTLAADTEAPEPPAYSFRTLYLLQQGCQLRKDGEQLCVVKEGATLSQIPAHLLDLVLVYGHNQLTTPALQFCFERAIPVAYLTAQGRFCGVADALDLRAVELQMLQVQRHTDAAWCLEAARAIVRGKLENSRLALQRGSRHRQADTHDAEIMLRDLATHTKSADTLETLNGIEGAGAKEYFAAWAKLLPDGWRFDSRNRQPPLDPVNALLSYGYTLLYWNLYALLRARGLNPHWGAYHALRAGHAALASDLIEEFRALLVDRLVLKLLHAGSVQPGQFTVSESGCEIQLDARRTLIEAFEAQLANPIRHPDSGLIDWRRVIDGQALLWIRTLRGQAEYRRFEVR